MPFHSFIMLYNKIYEYEVYHLLLLSIYATMQKFVCMPI